MIMNFGYAMYTLSLGKDEEKKISSIIKKRRQKKGKGRVQEYMHFTAWRSDGWRPGFLSYKLILSLIYIYFSAGKGGVGRIAPRFFFSFSFLHSFHSRPIFLTFLVFTL